MKFVYLYSYIMSQDILQKYHIRAKKALGQNFLVDEYKVSAIARSISVSGENIIEVWPWYGALTEKLLEQNPWTLHLVELDKDMIEILEDRFSWSLFQLFQQNILDFIPEFSEYSVIANIPYYITSPILRHFLYDLENTPENMIILMQKDVGGKILWKWKNKSSVLSLMIEKKCRVSQEMFVWKENFVPAPKIESSVLKFEIHKDFDETNDEKFLEIIKIAFSSPRKKLIKNLITWGFEKQKIWDFFRENNFDENIRGEDLSVGEWCKLVNYLG